MTEPSEICEFTWINNRYCAHCLGHAGDPDLEGLQLL